MLCLALMWTYCYSWNVFYRKKKLFLGSTLVQWVELIFHRSQFTETLVWSWTLLTACEITVCDSCMSFPCWCGYISVYTLPPYKNLTENSLASLNCPCFPRIDFGFTTILTDHEFTENKWVNRNLCKKKSKTTDAWRCSTYSIHRGIEG